MNLEKMNVGIHSLFNFSLIVKVPGIYLVLFSLYGFFAIYMTYKIRISFAPLEDHLVQGTLEWESVTNLITQYYAVPVHPFCEGQDYYSGKPGFPICRVPNGVEGLREQKVTQLAQDGKQAVFKEDDFQKEKIKLSTKELTNDSLENLMKEARERKKRLIIQGKAAIPLYEELHMPEAKTRKFFYLIGQEPSNSIVLALTRGGKDVYFINPFIDILSRAERIGDRPSFVMTATKGDEPRMWYDTLRKRGYLIRICNTVRQYYSDPYNPLSVVFNYYKKYMFLKADNRHESTRFLTEAENELKRSAFTFFQSTEGQGGSNGEFWVKACRNLFMSTGLAIADQAVRNNEPIKFNPYAIYNIVNEMQSIRINENNPEYIYSLTEDPLERVKLLKKYDGKSALDVFFLELPRNHPAKKYYYAILASAPAEVTMGNVITHFDGDMEMFLNEANAKMSATDDGFDFEELGFGDQPVACFIVMSQTEKSNNALGMLYLEQAYQVNEKRCTLETPSRTYRDVHFIIQEAGNLGVAIQNLTNKWTSGLGQGFFFHLVLQDLEQLTSLYSESIKKTIVGNTGNLVYIRSGSLDTNKYISERLGKRTNYSKDRSRQDPLSLKVSERETSERIDLLSPSELERLRKSETIVLRLSHVDDLDGEPIYQYPIYNSIETDTNMLPFYEYRNNQVLSWDQIPVNNDFMDLEMDDLLITLTRVEESKKVLPSLVTKKTIATRAYKEKELSKSSGIETIDSPENLRKEGDLQMVNSLNLHAQDEVNQLYNDVDQVELTKKEQLYQQLRGVFPSGSEEKKVADFFSEKEIQQLYVTIRVSYLRDSQVLKEFREICKHQTIQSFLSFISSNDKKNLVENMMNKVTKMKGAKK
ncbi:type IV secretory system conjugative DNA transfer family protein [Enterococcus faecalis]|uniref:type IV secretory system conjugative DNA transfer family protein n=1 Tax=Enterococcus faecalis TaxID=1351 RepID=UPI0021AF3B3F|nr:type IV secretory system conjugative DNA transfer family protein [Enterococcus faecalis]